MVQFSNAAFMTAQDTTGSNFQIGTVTVSGSGSITITWAKTGTPTGTFNFSIRCFE